MTQKQTQKEKKRSYLIMRKARQHDIVDRTNMQVHDKAHEESLKLIYTQIFLSLHVIKIKRLHLTFPT